MSNVRVTKSTKQKDRESFMRRQKRVRTTPAQVAAHAVRRGELLGRMSDVAAKHDEELINLAKEHNRSVKWASPYNTFLWKRAHAFREDAVNPHGRGTLKAMNKELSDEYYALDADKLAQIMKEYEQHCLDKAHVAHHVAPAQHADFDKTFKNLMDVVTAGVAAAGNQPSTD
ncbi:hypothetical protein AURDEDRAFT_166019 [Auricularia subglabra TFB-10046 SS5]|nr:hypothetical protein AURDEDRAFT_166019 [Auricularia subglabra TFB-10046 SS5]